MPTTAMVDLGHVTLGCRTTGGPPGLPVVLLHGLGEDATDWDGFAAELAGSCRWAIAVDLRGLGPSNAWKASFLTLNVSKASFLALPRRT